MPERTPSHSTTPHSDGRIRPSANPDQSTSPSRQQSLADVRANIKSLIFKNLVASPIFPRLYADLVLHYAPNSPAAKILAPHYKKIVERTNQLMANVKSCTHIKVSGVRCGSPCQEDRHSSSFPAPRTPAPPGYTCCDRADSTPASPSPPAPH